MAFCSASYALGFSCFLTIYPRNVQPMVSEDFIMIIILLVLIIIAYRYIFVVIKGKNEAKAASERERNVQAAIMHKAEQAAQAKVFEEKHAELAITRSSEMEKNAPKYIQEALSKFSKEYKSDPSKFKSMNELSPLACFGYKVGKTSGLTENQRHEVIYYTWYAKIPSIIPSAYAREWGAPGTYKRFHKIVNHISMLANQRASRSNFEVAIAHWTADAHWFERNYSELAQQYKHFGFK